ncbi:Uncharacterised protein [Streptococcus pneumoniae]|nr:Uncharacterised protein [Streptococcus pneumoniae]
MSASKKSEASTVVHSSTSTSKPKSRNLSATISAISSVLPVILANTIFANAISSSSIYLSPLYHIFFILKIKILVLQ